ncbi:hypothetical protein Emed_003348 [Eimeria media]
MSTLSPLLCQTPWMLLSVLLILLLAQENVATLRKQPAAGVELEGGSFEQHSGQLFQRQSVHHPASPRIIPLNFMRLDRSQSSSLSDRVEHFPQMSVAVVHRVITVVAFLLAILFLCYAFQPSNANQSDRPHSVPVPHQLRDVPYVPTNVSKENDKEAPSASKGAEIRAPAGRGTKVPHVALREDGNAATTLAAAGAYLYFKLELLANYCHALLPLLPDSLQPSILRTTIVFGMQELSVLSVLYAGEFEQDRRRAFEAFMRLKDEACQRVNDWQLKDTTIPQLSIMLDQLLQLDVAPISALELHRRLVDLFLPSSEQAIMQFSGELKTLMGCIRRTGNVDEDVSSSVQSALLAVTAERLQQILKVPQMSDPLIACYKRLPLASGTVETAHPSKHAEPSARAQVAGFSQDESGVWTVPAKSQQRTAIASTGSESKVREPLGQEDDVDKAHQLQPIDVQLVAAEAATSQSSEPSQDASEEPPPFLMRPIEPAPQVSQSNQIRIVKPTPIYAPKRRASESLADVPEEHVPQP